MKLVVNGDPRELDAAITVAQLLLLDNEPVNQVLVAINGVFVPPSQHTTTRFADGDQVEIINPIFGG
jgi:sulfur carrier protein